MCVIARLERILTLLCDSGRSKIGSHRRSAVQCSAVKGHGMDAGRSCFVVSLYNCHFLCYPAVQALCIARVFFSFSPSACSALFITDAPKCVLRVTFYNSGGYRGGGAARS